jgi:superfamily I DNA/RNA helicase
MLSQDIQTKQQLLDKLNLIFKDNENNGVCLSTIHKAKGLESDNVFILNKNLLPSRYVKQDWELEQEKNLEYVALTRAKKTLGFIYSKEFNSISENKNIEEKILDLKYKINNC